MMIDKGIPIKNIYYMLTYAFKELTHNNYEQIAGEDFENIYDLFAEILSKGMAYLLKQGLHKEYIEKTEPTTLLRGKLNLQKTMQEKRSQRVQLVCEYDELTENNLFNQILKTSVLLLVRHTGVDRRRKHALRRAMLFFERVDEIKPADIHWHRLRYDRNSRTYRMLHSLCYFLLQNELLTTEDGFAKMPKFSDEHMNLLFQRFVLNYYKRHHPQNKPWAKQIKWNFVGETESNNILPIMQSDILLSIGERTLIIDTKYYSHIMQENFGKHTIHSPNFYQIYTYVMNEDTAHTGKVDGILLYACPLDNELPDDVSFTHRDGNIFMIRTLDMNQDFSKIKMQLDSLLDYRQE